MTTDTVTDHCHKRMCRQPALGPRGWGIRRKETKCILVVLALWPDIRCPFIVEVASDGVLRL
jgi:hypothetical protein